MNVTSLQQADELWLLSVIGLKQALSPTCRAVATTRKLQLTTPWLPTSHSDTALLER